MSIRSRNYQAKLLRETGVTRRTHRYLACYGMRVRRGPFAGMTYISAAVRDRNVIPRLIGSYELELHAALASALAIPYDVIVDIGSAEGFYSTGFALKTQAPVVGYEVEPRERALAAQMAAANGVTVELRGHCTPRHLLELQHKRALVMSDCEGAELSLFTPETLAAFTRCDLLIELHGQAISQLPPLFTPTHHIEVIAQSRRNPAGYPELSIFPEHERDAAISEYRGEPQTWLWARAQPA